MVNSFKVEEVELKYTEILAQLRVDNFIQFKEPETEPLDLSMSRVCGGRIEPSDVSIPELRYQNETSNIQTFKRKHPGNTTHTSAKQFKCEKEDFVALPNTYVMNHTDKKMYCCPKCGKNFTRSSVLNEHMKKTHTGDMRRHMKNVHDNAGPDSTELMRETDEYDTANSTCPDCEEDWFLVKPIAII
uniref:C2H2-type domain-containing protein n=1 Tax=Loa loa TaxID=7209 RepID=A0A1I7V9L8_LOALO